MNKRKQHPRWLRALLRVAAIVCFGIWLIWAVDTAFGSFSPLAAYEMPHLTWNAAFALLLCSMFFALLDHPYLWANIALGLLLIGLASATLATANFGNHPPLNTAAAMFAMGVAALIVGIWRERRLSQVMVATIGSVVGAIALLGPVSQATAITEIFPWAIFADISPLPACGFFVCGLGLVAWAIDGTRRISSLVWLAVPVFIGFELATVGLWMAMRANQAEHLDRLLTLRANALRVEIETTLGDNIEALARLAKRTERFAGAVEEQWQFDASLILRDFPSFRSIALIDGSGLIRSAVPTPPNINATALAAARRSNAIKMSTPITLSTAEVGTAIVVPIGQPNPEGLSLIEAELSVASLLSQLHSATDEFDVAASSAGEMLVQSPINAKSAWAKAIKMESFGSSWTVHLNPTAKFFARTKTTLPEQVLFAGSLIGIALAGIIALTQSLTVRRRQTEEINQRLEQNIAKLTATEKELGVSQERLTVALKGANLALWEWDFGQQTAYYSPLWKAHLGYTEDEIGTSGDEWTKRVHPDDVERTVAAIKAQQKSSAASFEVEYRLQHRSGNYLWVLTRGQIYRNSQGEPESMVGINIDVTQRKEADERFAKFLEAAPDGLIVVDSEGKVIHANAQTLSLFGYSAGELIGKDVELLVPESTRGIHRLERKNFVETGQARRMGNGRELLGQRKDGTTVDVEISLNSVRSGPQTLVLASIRDIADRRRLEAELKKAKILAEQASEMKSQFLANMSHEIRTPLGVILGHAELLASQTLTGKNRELYANAIKRNGENLTALINDLLDLAKIEAGRFEVEIVQTTLPTVIHDVINLLKIRAAEKGLYLRLSEYSQIPETVTTDAVRLRQILINIIGNAIKFTDSGGVEVSVTTSGGDEARTDATLTIDITDTGCGIAPEHYGKVFDPFVQADASVSRRFGGTGLGLSLSRRLARLLGGDVSIVSSKIGLGSRFRVTVAAGDLRAVSVIGGEGLRHLPAKETARASLHKALEGIRVLLVEDYEDNQQLMSAFLNSAGAIIDCASNGAEAVQKGKKFRYDVVLMDIQMPVMTGYEATKALRALGYPGPIIALTAHAMKGEREQCLEAGFSDFLSKPVQREQLIEKVREYARIAASPESSSKVARPTEPAIPVSPLLDDPGMRDAVRMFIEKLESRVDKMRNLAEKQQFSEVAKIAHQLKGAGGFAGYMIVTTDAAAIENAIRSGQDLSAVQPLLQTLTIHARKISDDAKRLLSSTV